MHSSRYGKDKKYISKKDKKLRKLINNSDSDNDDSEHELSYYLNDRVKMMREVLKIIKPKKIRSMAPSCMRNMDNEEINSMLLEELLGISNKRLRAIFNGQPLNEDSSSTDEEEQHPVDVISLDDVTDDDFVVDLDSDNGKEKPKRHYKKHRPKIKEEPKSKKIKKEKYDKDRSVSGKVSKLNDDGIMDQASEQHLMSVLELLELQARARAIRSQLALENSQKVQEQKIERTIEDEEDAVIVEEIQETEIIISSSDSEKEEFNQNEVENEHKNISDMEVNSFPCDTNKGSPNPGRSVSIIQDIVIRSVKDDSVENHRHHCVSETITEPSLNNTHSDTNLHLTDIPLPEAGSHSEITEKATINIVETQKTINSDTKAEPKIRRKHHRHHRRKKESENENVEYHQERMKSNSQSSMSSKDTSREHHYYEKEIKDKNIDPTNSLKTKSHSSKSKDKDFVNDGDGIVLNVDQSEIDCIELD